VVFRNSIVSTGQQEEGLKMSTLTIRRRRCLLILFPVDTVLPPPLPPPQHGKTEQDKAISKIKEYEDGKERKNKTYLQVNHHL
jgi:hypothetical protein